MSDRIEWFTVNVPAGTLSTAPITVPCIFQQGLVTEIDISVPPGPAGNVGFFIVAGGSQYVPRTPGSFVIVDDVYLEWPLGKAITSGSWAVTAYNTDTFAHVLQVGFQIDEVGAALDSTGSMIGASSASLVMAQNQVSATSDVIASVNSVTASAGVIRT